MKAQLDFLPKKNNVLLVDDNPLMRELGSECLRLNGYHVLLSVNGKEAIELLEKTSVDLILLDLQMPVMDGFETLKYLITNQIKVPILALTARGSRSDRDECISAGFNDVITKPYNLAEYSSIIKKYIG